MPVHDFTTHTRLPETERAEPAGLIIVDGILLLVELEMRSLLDIKVYVDTDRDVRLMRRLRRGVLERGRTVESVLEQYDTMVRPMHLEFVEPSKRCADSSSRRAGGTTSPSTCSPKIWATDGRGE